MATIGAALTSKEVQLEEKKLNWNIKKYLIHFLKGKCNQKNVTIRKQINGRPQIHP